MITDKDIDNLGELSRLELSAEEKAGYAKDLSNILAYIDDIKKVDVAGVNVIDEAVVNTMRDDIVTNNTGEYTESLVKAAPDNDGVYIKVKKVL
jgi:aspartyl-tRNA(Asn)/glutamyl-tRNA(Gln) amidotransferase subunit C